MRNGAGVDLKMSLGFPPHHQALFIVFLGLGGIALPVWFPMVSNGVPSGGTEPAASKDNVLVGLLGMRKG